MLSLAAKSGSYVIVLQSHEQGRIRIGRAGILQLKPGYYLYVGSAFGPGGLRARVSRHLRGSKRRHWHIDYLRSHTEAVYAWTQAAAAPTEHRWAAALAQMPGNSLAMQGFGASDCQCVTHLYCADTLPSLTVFSSQLTALGCEAEVQLHRPTT